MTIGIDVTTLVYQGSGVANYTYNLVYNLLIQDKKTNIDFSIHPSDDQRNSTNLTNLKISEQKYMSIACHQKYSITCGANITSYP